MVVSAVDDGSVCINASSCIWTFGTCLKAWLCSSEGQPTPIQLSLVDSVESCTINHSGENSRGCAYQVPLNVTIKFVLKDFFLCFQNKQEKLHSHLKRCRKIIWSQSTSWSGRPCTQPLQGLPSALNQITNRARSVSYVNITTYCWI